MKLPFNLNEWIDDHRDVLKPPVCNKMVFEDTEFIVMVVGGPNTRKDYHVDEGEEFFYQLEGEMCLRIREEGKPKDLSIKAGEIFLLPPRIPHSPQRFKNSVGLVIERKRRQGELDGFQWYCENCHEKLWEKFIPLTHIEKDLPPVLDEFWSSKEHRTCLKCGSIQEKN